MKKILINTLGTISVATPVVATMSCSSFLKGNSSNGSQKSDLSFMNYDDYINEDIQNEISNSFEYKTFGDLPELKQAILDQKIAAGVGSDYFNAQLAGMGLIQKIDFNKALGINKNRDTWAEELKAIYTPETWTLLNSFTLKKYRKSGDGYVIAHDSNGHEIHDVDGDGKQDYLWEYMIPYFIQNKVVAFNPYKIAETPANKADLDKLKSTDPSVVESVFGSAGHSTYKQILDKLHGLGFRKMAINNYFRDNLMIGSEDATGTAFSGNVPSIAKGKEYANGFINLLKGWNVVDWIDSGVDSLSTLVSPAPEKDAEVSMLYNGDALYAYNGADVKDVQENQVRIATPKNPTFLLDGVVIPSYIKDDWWEMQRVYRVLSQTLYQGVMAKPEMASFGENQIAKNFDYVNYSAAFKNLQTYIRDSYFVDDNKTPTDQSDDTTDEMGKYMSLSVETIGGQIDADHITQPIKESVETTVEEYFSNLHKTGIY